MSHGLPGTQFWANSRLRGQHPFESPPNPFLAGFRLTDDAPNDHQSAEYIDGIGPFRPRMAMPDELGIYSGAITVLEVACVARLHSRS